MSVSSITGSDQGLFQFFHSVSGTTAAQPTTAAPSVAPASDASTADDASASSPVAGHHHHHGGPGGGEFFKKVQDAVSSALQAAKDDPDADPNQTVEDAIAQVVKQNAPPGQAPRAADGSSSPPPADPGAAPPPGTDAPDASGRQAFFATLKSYGIDPKQFHQDLLAAVRDAKSGDSDPTTAFANVPPGLAVDTTA